MSLRVRLIIAFFLLSVLPLGAVTTYSYVNNVEALRVAAERETDLLAGELGQRMQLVTAQLGERVEHLMDLSEMQAQADARTAALERQLNDQASRTTAPAAQAAVTVESLVATALGDAAMLLNNVELRGLRRGGGPPRPDGPPGGSGSGRDGGRFAGPGRVGDTGSVAGGVAGTAAQGSAGGRGSRTGGRPTRPEDAQRQATQRTVDAGRAGEPPVPPPGPRPTPLDAGASVAGRQAGPPQSGEAAAAAAAERAAVDAGRMLIDLAPMRRELLREMVPEGQLGNLSADERARLGRELNARMMGIAEGIRIGAAELAKRAEAAKVQAGAQGKADAAGTATTVPRVTPPPAAPPVPAVTPVLGAPASPAAPAAPLQVTVKPLQRRTAITGNKLDIRMERDGEVVRQVNAEINLPNMLATVFSTTRRDRGEVPFAVMADGTIHAPTEEDRRSVAALGAVTTPSGPASARVGNWVVVTTPDTSGSGVRLGIARPVGDSLNDLRRTAARNGAVGLGLIGLALIGIVPLSSRLTRNLSALGDGVKRLAAGDYGARVPVRSQDEVGRLAAAFNQMAADVERHQRAAVEQERIKRELELGRKIQNEMLPHEPLRIGLTEIKGVSVPAREVGGDFFNYFEVPDGRLAMLVGDVSGKGVGAALLMANLQASLRTRLALGQNLAAIADSIDRDVEASSPGPVYATLFVGIFDPPSRRLDYVNAGHNPQFVLRQGGGLEPMSSAGLPVGLLAGRGYREQHVQLDAGDILFFYTDGCVEADNEQDEMFGTERLEQILLQRGPTDGTNDVMERVETAIKQFRGTREPFDDATMMTVRVG